MLVSSQSVPIVIYLYSKGNTDHELCRTLLNGLKALVLQREQSSKQKYHQERPPYTLHSGSRTIGGSHFGLAGFGFGAGVGFNGCRIATSPEVLIPLPWLPDWSALQIFRRRPNADIIASRSGRGGGAIFFFTGLGAVGFGPAFFLLPEAGGAMGREDTGVVVVATMVVYAAVMVSGDSADALVARCIWAAACTAASPPSPKSVPMHNPGGVSGGGPVIVTYLEG
jgi:hypothetical protein